MAYGIEDLDKYCQGSYHRQPSKSVYFIAQSDAIDKVHDHVWGAAFRGNEVMDAHYVIVVHATGGGGFKLEAQEAVRCIIPVGQKDLDRPKLIYQLVASFVDNAHAAFADTFDYLVVAAHHLPYQGIMHRYVVGPGFFPCCERLCWLLGGGGFGFRGGHKWSLQKL